MARKPSGREDGKRRRKGDRAGAGLGAPYVATGPATFSDRRSECPGEASIGKDNAAVYKTASVGRSERLGVGCWPKESRCQTPELGGRSSALSSRKTIDPAAFIVVVLGLVDLERLDKLAIVKRPPAVVGEAGRKEGVHLRRPQESQR